MSWEEAASFTAESRQLELKLLNAISRSDWNDSGYSFLWQVVAHRLRVTAAEAKRLVRRIELVCSKVGVSGGPIEPKLPAVRKAMADGEASGEHLDRIAKVIDKIPAESLEQADVELADAARRFDPNALSQIGRKLVDVLDPDGPEPVDPTIVEAQNELDIRDHEDGSISGRFTLGAETAAHLRPLLSSLTKPQKDEQRTFIERQGDALAEIVRFAANTGKAPIEGGERPHIAVTVSLETLRTAIGEATLDDGHTITPEQTRRLACDAGIIPMILGTNSQPIDIGESKRTADKRLRRALAQRDEGCAAPGCSRTPNQCQAHHLTHWVDGGPTILENMVLVCHFHHTLIHHAGWTVAMENGLPVFTPPEWLRRPAA